MNSLQVTDKESAAVATHPRVSLSDIEAFIGRRYDFTGAQAVQGLPVPEVLALYDPLDILSICILVTVSGFTVIGKSAPASHENFDAELGKKFAYEDAMKQLWPLMGFALRDRLWRDSDDAMRFHGAR